MMHGFAMRAGYVVRKHGKEVFLLTKWHYWARDACKMYCHLKKMCNFVGSTIRHHE